MCLIVFDFVDFNGIVYDGGGEMMMGGRGAMMGIEETSTMVETTAMWRRGGGVEVVEDRGRVRVAEEDRSVRRRRRN